jgi:integrase
LQCFFILARGFIVGTHLGDNPARWRGHMDKLLPSIKKKLRVKHHAALPFDQIGAFMGALRSQEGMAARALEFLILTAARTGEVIGANWDEIDLRAALWTVPAERMKASIEHRVPLSPRAVAIIRELGRTREGYVFPGQKDGAPLSNMAMLELLKRMERGDLTVHGFRSSFRDWTAERTNYPREVCEMALAHTVSNQAEAAYRRGDLFNKRADLMREWAKHCNQIKRDAKVHVLRRRA